MRYSIIAFISCTILACSSQKKVSYEFPAAMAGPVKKEFAKECDKGQVLYNINCAQCHNLVVKGKQVIPDFKPEQLIGYELRVANPQHEGSMPDTKVTAEELGQIMTFLSYKTKSNIPMAKKL
jgi:mono/diheme cytochrome c family protein